MKIGILFRFLSLVLLLVALPSCSTVRATGKVIGTTGKAVYHTAKWTGKAAVGTAKAAHKGIKWLAGAHEIPLIREGNTYYVEAMVERRYKVKFVLDTGASLVQIPMSLAKELGAQHRSQEKVRVTVANGQVIEGRAFDIKEIALGGARAKNVKTVVVKGRAMGLLGMSYLQNFRFEIDTDKLILYLKEK